MSEQRAKPWRFGWLRFFAVVAAVGMCGYFGRSQMKHLVPPGTPRGEAKLFLLGERKVQGPVLCVLIGPGVSGTPPPMASYPKPFLKAEYPEYGFDVFYHGKLDEPMDAWKVVAVEERE